MGRMASALLPIAEKYNKKTDNERYLFRRDLRKFIKWYGYVSQVVRMFDKDLHQEYVFCSYLLKIIPAEQKEEMNLDGKLKLEYYKLQKTFEGTIKLVEEKGEYDPPGNTGGKGGNKKEPLEEIIQKINERFKGNFTQGDIVVLTTLHNKLKDNPKLAKDARTSEHQIFKESIFPNVFQDAAQESYLESTETFTSLFENKEKYNAMMNALAEVLYREFSKMK